jgi:hypothetical protein
MSGLFMGSDLEVTALGTGMRPKKQHYLQTGGIGIVTVEGG